MTYASLYPEDSIQGQLYMSQLIYRNGLESGDFSGWDSVFSATGTLITYSEKVMTWAPNSGGVMFSNAKNYREKQNDDEKLKKCLVKSVLFPDNRVDPLSRAGGERPTTGGRRRRGEEEVILNR